MKCTYTLDAPFQFENGLMVENLTLTYHLYGDVNDKGKKLILVFHPLSANGDPVLWWPILFGPNKLLDVNNYNVLCINSLCSPYGSWRPQQINFPVVTVRDVVRSYWALIDNLGISNIDLCIGPSYGGSQLFEFIVSYPNLVQKALSLGAAAAETPWSKAVHATQKMALEIDLQSQDSNHSGLALARAIGMMFYRAPENFAQNQSDPDDVVEGFQVDSYLKYQGQKFVQRFDALTYMHLIRTLDSHNIGRNSGGVETDLKRIKTAIGVVTIDSDILISAESQNLLMSTLPHAKQYTMRSIYGHDGFLIEEKQLNIIIQDFFLDE